MCSKRRYFASRLCPQSCSGPSHVLLRPRSRRSLQLALIPPSLHPLVVLLFLHPCRRHLPRSQKQQHYQHQRFYWPCTGYTACASFGAVQSWCVDVHTWNSSCSPREMRAAPFAIRPMCPIPLRTLAALQLFAPTVDRRLPRTECVCCECTHSILVPILLLRRPTQSWTHLQLPLCRPAAWVSLTNNSRMKQQQRSTLCCPWSLFCRSSAAASPQFRWPARPRNCSALCSPAVSWMPMPSSST
mmetsp:Transcript_17787/g.53375  ORF Transcript_17787/g.53375 Transcript_17787/m.53375 type:complete len:243 (-) Transcript_17787:1126-1854(-)